MHLIISDVLSQYVRCSRELLFQVIMAIKDFFNAVIEYETPRYVKVSGSDTAFLTHQFIFNIFRSTIHLLGLFSGDWVNRHKKKFLCILHDSEHVFKNEGSPQVEKFPLFFLSFFEPIPHYYYHYKTSSLLI